MDVIKIRIGLGGTTYVFFLKPASVAEEAELLDKFAALEDAEDKEARGYEVLKDFVANISAQVPEKTVIEKGKEKKIKFDSPVALSVIEKEFAEQTAANDRILNTLVNAYRSRLMPTVDFL